MNQQMAFGGLRDFDLLGNLVDSLGTAGFYPNLKNLIGSVCHSTHLGAYKVTPSGFRSLGAVSEDGSDLASQRVRSYAEKGLWKLDPSVDRVFSNLRQDVYPVLHVDVSEVGFGLKDTLYPDIRDKAVMMGVKGDSGFMVTVVRSEVNCSFTRSEISDLLCVSGVVISLVAKHQVAVDNSPDKALQSLETIETVISSEGLLSNREAQVCARALYGMCSGGIALDLGIGEETVKTYKSRAYQRLEIGTQRELLIWYLSKWRIFGSLSA